jgi:hypothetical protein
MGIVYKTEEERNPTNQTPAVVEEDLTQIVYNEGEEGELAIRFIEENHLLDKFLLWQGIQEQLKKLKDSLATTE